MNITVYITSYNQNDLLKSAIESVLQQNLTPYEIIIVDDASIDGSQELILEYADKHPNIIRYFFFEENQGIARVRSKAIEKARGDYITYLDGDDLYHPDKLKIEAQLLTTNSTDVAFSNFYRFTNHINSITSIWISNRKQLPEFGNMFYEVFTRKFPSNNLFRYELASKKVYEKIGFYDSNLSTYEDYEFKIRMAKVSRICYTLLPLSYYRDNPKGLSKTKKMDQLANFKYIFDKHIQDIRTFHPNKINLVEKRFNEFFKKMDQMEKHSTKEIIKDKLIHFIKSL